MNKHPRCSVPVALLVLNMVAAAATPCFALDSTDNPLLTLTANYNTIQFKVSYEGDDNQNATLFVRYWRTNSPTAIDTAVVPTRDVRVPRFTGVIFWLDEATSYTVQAKVYDSDGIYPDLQPPVYTATITQSITTRNSAPPTLTGDTVWVSPSGNDAYKGSLDSTKRTLAGAYTKLLQYPQYRHIRVLPGIYYETFPPYGSSPLNGTSTNYYSIKGVGDPNSIIIDGSDTALLSTTWTLLSSNDHIYYRIYPNARSIVKQVTAGVDQRLHKKASDCPRELVDFQTCVQYEFNPDFPHQGYRIALDPNPQTTNDTLLVRLEGGISPSDSMMHVSIRPTVVITGGYWLVENLTARFSQWDGIDVGWYATPGVIVRGCKSYNNAGNGVFVNNDSNQPLIDACSVWDGRIGSWSYFASKLRAEIAGIVSLSPNTVVRGCTVTSTANGIQVAANSSMNPDWGRDSDVYYNKVTNMADDALENDFNQGVNVAVWGNFVKDANNGWSQTTADIGPTYVMYNVFDTFKEAAIKLGATPNSGDSAHVFYYHNTFTGTTPFNTIRGFGVSSNQVFANNIMVGRSAATPGQQDRLIVDDHYPPHPGTTLDYDLNWRVVNPSDPYKSIVWYWGGNRTWPEVCTQLGFECHGKNEAPAFADSAGGNFRPSSSSSPQVDMGTRIQGVNTPHKTQLNSAYLYSGKPDVGAYEFNYPTKAQPPFRLGRTPIEPGTESEPVTIGFSLSAPHPNPALGAASFQLTLTKRTEIEAGIYDVSGRLVRLVAARRAFPAGKNELTWDGRDQGGVAAPTGMYFLRVQARSDHAVRRVMMLR